MSTETMSEAPKTVILSLENSESYTEAVTMAADESCAFLIEEFGAIKDVRDGTYNKLFATVTQQVTFDAASDLLDRAEMIYINACHSPEAIASQTTKSGKIKRTKFLPNDYLSAKSVLLNAMQKGVPMYDEAGEPLGKSALSSGVSGSSKTAQQKLDAAMSNALRYAQEVHGTDDVHVYVWVAGECKHTSSAS